MKALVLAFGPLTVGLGLYAATACDHQLTVQDAQLGLRVACESLATVLAAKHPGSPPEAWQLALEACNVERTTHVMDVLLSRGSTAELLPFTSFSDAGVTP